MTNKNIGIGLLILSGAILFLRKNSIDPSDTDIAIIPNPNDNDADNLSNSNDLIALARMIASETSNYRAKTIIGWITKNVAARRHTSIYKLLTQNTGKWGKQDRRDTDEGIMYASTSKSPSDWDIELARKILNNEIEIPEAVKNIRPGAWYEKLSNVTDKMLIERQKSWNEGIYARIEGTKWYLYSSQAPKVNSLDDVITV